MELKTQRIRLELEDATFIMKDPGLDGLYRMLKDESKAINIDLFFDNLISIEGLTLDGDPIVSPNDLRKANPPASFIGVLVKALVSHLMDNLSDDSLKVKTSKNG